jgi:hypothetical protein
MPPSRSDQLLIKKLIEDHGFACGCHTGEDICAITEQQFMLGFREATFAAKKTALVPKTRVSTTYALGWVLGDGSIFTFNSVDAEADGRTPLIGTVGVPTWIFCCAKSGKEIMSTLGYDTARFKQREWRDDFLVPGTRDAFTKEVRDRLLT